MLIHAKWLNWESTETPTIAVFNASNSLTRSLKAIISVGHTNVLKTTQNILLIQRVIHWIFREKHKTKTLTNQVDRKTRPNICLCNRTIEWFWSLYSQRQFLWNLEPAFAHQLYTAGRLFIHGIWKNTIKMSNVSVWKWKTMYVFFFFKLGQWI